MIKGTKHWDLRKTFSVQTNNSVEAILRKALSRIGKDRGFLETCGPTSAINLLDAMGKPTAWYSPTMATIQPEDALTLWLNNPANTAALQVVRKDIDPDDYLGNEIPQYYPHAIGACFGVTARYLEGQSFDWIQSVVTQGHGVMICLKSPGHYLAVVAYDYDTKELIYRDPWPGRTGTDGYNLRMGREEFESNTKPFCVVFG